MRAVLDAIFYVTKSGCQWGMLPRDFPAKSTVHADLKRWEADGTWAAIQLGLRDRVRRKEGFGPSTTAAVDSQSIGVAAGVSDAVGTDGGKKVKGRKRHIVADSLSFVLAVVVTAASVSDAAGARLALGQLSRPALPRLARVFADSAYKREGLPGWVESKGWYQLEVVPRPPGSKGWVRLPKRWVVERAFGWMMHARRLLRDHEKTPASAQAFVYASQIRILLRRLTSPPPLPDVAQRLAA